MTRVRSRLLDGAPWIFAGLWFVFAIVRYDGRAGLSPDSQSYLENSPIRSLPYPAFLDLCRGLGLSVDAIPVVQMVIAALAIGWFVHALLRRVPSLLLVAAVVVPATLLPRAMGYHGMILTESTFFSTVFLFAGFLLRWVDARETRWFVGLAATAAVMAAMRPVGLAFVVLAVLAAIGIGRHRGWSEFARASLILAGVGFAVIGGERVAYQAVHGPAATSLMPKHLFGRAAVVGGTGVERDDPAARRLEREIDRADAVRRLIEGAPDPYQRAALTTIYETAFQHRFSTSLQTELGLDDETWHPLLAEVGAARIRRAPGSYMRISLRHYLGLWNLFGDSHPASVASLRTYLDANEPLPMAEYVDSALGTLHVSRTAVVSRPLIQFLAVVSLAVAPLGLVVVLRRRALRPELEAAGLLGLQVHGYFLLIGLTGISILRYTLAVWPLLLVVPLLLAWAFLPAAWRERLP